MDRTRPFCPHCGGRSVEELGLRDDGDIRAPKFQCRRCGGTYYRFTNVSNIENRGTKK